MPCMSYDTNWANHSVYKDSRELKLLKEEADKLARIACQALYELEKVDPQSNVLSIPSELTVWWRDHKKADAARAAAELKEKNKKAALARKNAELKRKRQAALAKLTDEEQAVFGLKVHHGQA
jgi:hypothetical protein